MFRGVIIIVDRFAAMNSLISSYLTASGYDVRTLRSPDKLTDERISQAHLVLMDIDTAGDMLRQTAERLNRAGIPLIVLTSENDSAGRLTALGFGAADVMSRPLDLAELTARIRSAQGRTNLGVPSEHRPAVNYGGLSADITTYRVTLDGELLSLSPRESALLYLLMSSMDTVFSREEISRRLGGSMGDRTINAYVSNIKKAIGEYSENIVSVRSVGYKFLGNTEN